MRSAFLVFFLPFSVMTLAGCPVFDASSSDPTASGQGGIDVTHQETEISGTLALAIGGGAIGADEISISDSFRTLDFTTEDGDLLALGFRGTATSYADGGGTKVTPLKEGIAYVTPVEDSRARDPIKVIIPPQKLVQILLGEARGQIKEEATLDDNGNVKPTSVSVTGNAIGAVIRNRMNRINDANSPGLFEVDATAYAANPPVSYYNAIIEASRGDVYQFGPLDPKALSHSVYLEAAKRGDLPRAVLVAYDQAVLTAAYIFDEDTKDPTGGAFSFYSPEPEEYAVLENALKTQTTTLPAGAGTSDKQYPSLAPVQVLILKGIAPSADNNDVPSFVFVRKRHPDDPAVTDAL